MFFAVITSAPIISTLQSQTIKSPAEFPGYKMGKEWFIMKRTADYPFLTTGSNIGYILEKEPVAGFAGYKYKDKIKNTLVPGSEKIGSGEVIYISDDPYFRVFWKSGRVFMGNMILR